MGMNENNHCIMFQTVCWILDLPVLNFGVMFKNVMCQLVEMIIQQTLSYIIYDDYQNTLLVTPMYNLCD